MNEKAEYVKLVKSRDWQIKKLHKEIDELRKQGDCAMSARLFAGDRARLHEGIVPAAPAFSAHGARGAAPRVFVRDTAAKFSLRPPERVSRTWACALPTRGCKKAAASRFFAATTTLINQTSAAAGAYGLSAHGIVQANHPAR